MKVKNIVFSGFAAALFVGVCGAAHAVTTPVELTSKTYVDAAVAVNTTAITKLQEETLPALRTALEKAIEDGDKEAADAIAELQETVEGLSGSVATNETMEALSNRVKAIEEAPYATQSYVADAVRVVSNNLSLYATTEYVDSELANKVDSASLATVATSGSYTDLLNKPTIPSIEGLVNTTALQEAVSQLESAINQKASATDMQEAQLAIETANAAIKSLQTDKASAADLTRLENALNALGDVYATDTELSGKIAEVSALIPTNVSDLTNDAGYITEAALAPYATTEGVNAALDSVDAELAKKADADSIYTKTQIDTTVGTLATKTELSTTKEQLQVSIDKISAGDVELTNYYTKGEMDESLGLKADKTTVATDIAAALKSAKDYTDENKYDDDALRTLISDNRTAISNDATKIATNTNSIQALQAATADLKAMAYVESVATDNIQAAAVTPAKIQAGEAPGENEMVLMTTGADGTVSWMPVKVYY